MGGSGNRGKKAGEHEGGGDVCTQDTTGNTKGEIQIL